MSTDRFAHRVGWIGTGRMGSAIATRMLDAGVDLGVWNRTRSKAEALEAKGAHVVDSPADLADREIVFTMVAGPSDVIDVTFGAHGVLTNPETRPSILVDSTTIDPETSASLRERASEIGTAVLASPVSGNPQVVDSGQLTVVTSGPRAAFDTAVRYLELFGRTVTYVGAHEEARLVKIAHNLLLGAVTQSMAEITLLCEKSGVKRSDLFDFLNNSVMGSTFTRYKTPAFVNLDFTPTFTSHLLRKDLELGLAASRQHDVPLPLTALVHQIVMENIGLGHGDGDFANLLSRQATVSGVNLTAESIDVASGLE